MTAINTADIPAMGDQELMVNLMKADQEIAEELGNSQGTFNIMRYLEREAEVRWSAEGLARVGRVCLECKMSPEDNVRWAQEDWPHLESILKSSS